MHMQIGTLGKLVEKGMKSQRTGFDCGFVGVSGAELGRRLRAGGCAHKSEQGK
jgi:hypothetical protein